MPYLKVIRASAGSGKTFSLAGEFLVLLFNDPEKFRNILAVTFTNKATEEMKSRIIKEIFNISSGKHTPYLTKIIKETGLDEPYIRKKAGYILSVILHDYSRFSVCTIDSFFQRIIRSFTAELGLQTGYSIEIDITPVLKDVVERLFQKLDSDAQLLEWLSGYAETLIDEGESWNFRKGIERLGNEIFKEEFAWLTGDASLKMADRKMILDFRKRTYAVIEKCSAEYSAIGKQALQIMDLYSLSVEDFSYKSQGVAGFFAKISAGSFTGPSDRIREAMAGSERCWYPKNSDIKDVIIEACNNGMLEMLNRAADYYDTNERLYNTSAEILKNLYNLGILSDLAVNVSDYCNDNNVFILSEASSFIRKIIDDNDTPFIYEKAGQWVNHFMIDEFQDTSMLQWMNFKPLISNSLSQNFNNLLVGDVKQSIYRWRNSNWEILAKGVEKEYTKEVLKFEDLYKNYRSAPEIVLFNNDFFSQASSLLQQQFNAEASGSYSPESDEITGVYSNMNQVPVDAGVSQGSVTVRFFPDDRQSDEYREFVCLQLMDEIIRLMSSGYSESAIAILTRSNAEATKIAGYILSYKNSHPELPYNLDVISDEALVISGSSSVRFLVTLLKYAVDPKDKTNNYQILSEYINYVKKELPDDGYTMPEELYPEWEESFEKILPEGFTAMVSKSGRLSLSELVAEMILLFRLGEQQSELLYLQSFQDIILDFVRRHSSDMVRFIEYWEESGKYKAVTAPASQEAIRVLTIHKAKGLEFDVVLIPFCIWKINSYGDIMWCRTDEYGSNAPDLFPVKFTSLLSKTFFADNYFEEVKKQYVDNLNLLYVAFTRAKKSLIVYCRDGKKESENISVISDVSQLVRTVISGNAFINTESNDSHAGFQSGYNNDKKVLHIGKDEVTGVASGDLAINEGIIAKNSFRKSGGSSDINKKAKGIQERLSISFRNADLYYDEDEGRYMVPVSRGRILHEVFSNIRILDDIPSAVKKLLLQGRIGESDYVSMLTRIKGYFNDGQVMNWFDGSWKVITEAEIILPDGITRRPDRVMISGKNAVVLDYKFGLGSSERDRKQVSQYMTLLERMDYTAQGYLWYVEQGKVTEVK